MLPVRYRSPSSGRPLISVTQILTLAGRIDDRWFTEESRDRGIAVHKLTEDMDRGGHFIIPPGLGGYADAYAKFLAVVRPTYAGSEVEATSDLYELGGRIDRVLADLWGFPGILDFKTGDPLPWHGQQLAGYNLILPSGPRWACYLRPNGSYALKQYDDPQDHREFVYDLARKRGTVLPDGDHWIAA